MCYKFTNQIMYSQHLTHNSEPTVSLSLYTERLTTCICTNTTWSNFLTSILVLIIILYFNGIYLKFTYRIQCTYTPHAYNTEYAYCIHSSGASHNHTLYIMQKPYLQINNEDMWVQSVINTIGYGCPI